MVVSLGRSGMLILIMRNPIKSTIIPYFQIEQDDNIQMNTIQKKLVVMMEDLKHYHHSFIILTHLSKYNSQYIENNNHRIGWIEENSHSITQFPCNL